MYAKRPAFYQNSGLYRIWKWTGLSKDRLFIKTPSLPYMEVDRSFKRPAFYQNSGLYPIWKWTGLSKDRLFYQNSGLYPIWKWAGLSKNPTFHQKPGFLTQNSLFFKVIKRLNQSFHFFHEKKHDYKHVR